MQHAHVNEILDERAQFNRMKKEIEELKKTLEQAKNSEQSKNIELNSELNSELNEQLEAEKKKNEDLLKKLKDQFLGSTSLWQSGDRFLAPPVAGGNNFIFLRFEI